MATGASVLAKVTSVLRRTHVTSRVVKFRQVLVRHGNPLLGIGQERANVDTVVDPQPVVDLIKPEDVAAAGNLLQLGDYKILFDGNVTEAQIRSQEILYGNDVLKVVSYEPIVFDNTIVGWDVIARTSKAA